MLRPKKFSVILDIKVVIIMFKWFNRYYFEIYIYMKNISDNHDMHIKRYDQAQSRDVWLRKKTTKRGGNMYAKVTYHPSFSYKIVRLRNFCLIIIIQKNNINNKKEKAGIQCIFKY